MNAAMTLLRIQLRHLLWPTVAAIGAVFACFLINEFTGRGMLQDLIPAIWILGSALLAWISGPLVFGAEFVEGARDYLATRPIQVRKVFWTKVGGLVLFGFFAYSVLCFVGLEWDIPKAIRNVSFWVGFILYLDVLFWCSAATILRRDIVGGLLLGVATLLPVAGVCWYEFAIERHSWITKVPQGPLGGEWITGLILFLNLALLLSSPFLLFAILEIVHRRMHTHHLSLSMASSVCTGVFALITAGAICIAWNEGRTMAQLDMPSSFPGIVTSAAVWKDKLWTVQVQYLLGSSPLQSRALLYSFDYSNPEAVPHRVAVLCPTHGFQNDASLGVNFEEDRVLLLLDHWREKRKAIRMVGLPDGKRIPITLEGKPLEEIKESMKASSGGYFVQDMSDTWRSLDLQAGLVSDSTVEPPTILKNDVVCGEYRFRIASVTGEIPSVHVLAHDADDGDAPLGKVPLLINTVSDGRLIAGFETQSVRQEEAPSAKPAGLGMRWTWGDRKTYHQIRFDRVVLYDLTDPNELRRVYIDLPMRVRVAAYLQDTMLGTNHDDLPEVRLFLGSGMLCAWLGGYGRIIVWDVSQPEKIQPLGCAPIAYHLGIPLNASDQFDHYYPTVYGISLPTSPLIRSDGAIGYVTHLGPVWLEFPALMKTHAPTTQPSRDHQAAGEKPS
ncbi:MAG: hypothetical protein HUU16_00655 [Candidatus Omnitrophica bacterium]|nr:hypothetical protein [bacterium]NUN94659.1 hypothetical protein [Candidatus Omnitrophota bacterium]